MDPSVQVCTNGFEGIGNEIVGTSNKTSEQIIMPTYEEILANRTMNRFRQSFPLSYESVPKFKTPTAAEKMLNYYEAVYGVILQCLPDISYLVTDIILSYFSYPRPTLVESSVKNRIRNVVFSIADLGVQGPGTYYLGEDIIGSNYQMLMDNLKEIWKSFHEGNLLFDERLEQLIREIIDVSQEYMKKQMSRQQKAFRKVLLEIKSQTNNWDREKESDAIKQIRSHHLHDEVLGSTKLASEVGKSLVLCSKILNTDNLDPHFLLMCKLRLLRHRMYSSNAILFDEHFIKYDEFLKHFNWMMVSINSKINLDEICQMKPFRSFRDAEEKYAIDALLNKSPKFRPGTEIPVGPVRVKCEFEFADIILVPEEEDFHVPEGTSVKEFCQYIFQVYPQIIEYEEELEIQYITATTIHNLEPDSMMVLTSGEKLLFMD